MRFGRAIFFEQYRRHFGAIKQYQVDGLNRHLLGFETYYGWWDDIDQIANALSQVGWETAWAYQPVEEGYYLGNPDEPGYFDGENSAAVKRLQKSFRYYPHFGRGDIQLTWKENYADQDARIRKWFPERVTEFEQRTGKRFDLVGDPDQATDPWISFCVFTIGMHLGTFRPGHNLDRYITPSGADHFNARSIVNGDKNYVKQGKKIGQHIADNAVKFTAILNASLLADDADTNVRVPSSTATDPAGSKTASVEPALPVELPPADAGVSQDAPAQLTAEVEQTNLPQADPPDAEPQAEIVVEDWKPWVFRWLSRIWKGFGGVQVPNIGGFSLAAMGDLTHWYVYVIAAVVIFIGLLVLLGVPSAVLLAIWYFNRKEIGAAKMEAARSLVDPDRRNLKVRVEKK